MLKPRYVVGKTYPFITHTTKRVEGGSTFNSYQFDDNNHFQTVDTKIIMLTCASEHEVEIEYSDKKTKGYIFNDSQGNEYYNQYPTASYGQTSTISDFVVYTLISDGEEKPEMVHYISLKKALTDLERNIFNRPDKVTERSSALLKDMYSFLYLHKLKAQHSAFLEDHKVTTIELVDANMNYGVNTEMLPESNNLVSFKLVWALGIDASGACTTEWYNTKHYASARFDELVKESEEGAKVFLFPYVVSAREVDANIEFDILSFFSNVDRVHDLPYFSTLEKHATA